MAGFEVATEGRRDLHRRCRSALWLDNPSSRIRHKPRVNVTRTTGVLSRHKKGPGILLRLADEVRRQIRQLTINGHGKDISRYTGRLRP